MGVRRFFLNLGILAMLTGVVCAVIIFIQNLAFVTVEGSVIDYTEHTINYSDSQGNVTQKVKRYPVVEYTYGGQTYYDDVYYAKNVDYDELEDLAIDDTVVIYVNKYSPGNAEMPHFYYTALFFAVPGAIAILICRKAFKGYYTDFMQRYPKALGFTFAAEAFMLIFSPLMLSAADSADGLNGLGWFVLLLIVDAALILAILIVWLITFFQCIIRPHRTG